MSINLSALMKQRYDTAANWTAQNPTLLAGEIGIESDTKKWKVGTGATAWTSLVYAIGGTYPIVNADIAAGAEIAVSKLADGSARQLLQTDAAGTGVEWTSDVSIPGALSVTGNVNIDGGTLYVDVVNNRVGINTTGPTTALQVVGTARFGNGTAGTVSLTSDSNLSYYDSLNNAATAFQPSVLRATEIQFHTNTAGTTPTQKAVITSAGNVGIGTPSPAVALHVNGGNARIQQANFADVSLDIAQGGSTTGNKGVLNFQDSSGVTASITGYGSAFGSGLNKALQFSANGTAALTIDSSQRVGIGTTGPTSLVHLADAGNITVGTTTGTKIGTATTQKLGFYNATPVVQPAAVANATTAIDVITQLNDLLAKLRTLGIIAT